MSRQSIEAIRESTKLLFGDSTGDVQLDYITEELVANLEQANMEDIDATSPHLNAVMYGNRPVYKPDISRVGFVGRFYFYNGAPNRPNHPCGSASRRGYWVRQAPFGERYQNCGRFWGFKFQWL